MFSVIPLEVLHPGVASYHPFLADAVLGMGILLATRIISLYLEPERTPELGAICDLLG